MPVTRSTNLSRPQKNAPRLRLDYDVPYFGSLDTTSDPNLMHEQDSPDNLNVVYDTVQSVMSRKGYIKLLTTPAPGPIHGMYSLYQSSGARQLIYAATSRLYRYDNSGGSVTLSGTPSILTANQQWSFDEYQDTVYGGNSKNGLIAYNGTTYSVANAGISPQFVKIHKNRVYCVNASSSTLYFSDAGNPSSFPANNFILINTNDGQNITGIAEMMDSLIIFKDDSVWILTGEPLGAGNTTTIGNLQLRRANGVGGCSAFRTIQTVGDILFFMHHTGIYALQNYALTLVSPLLSTTFKKGMNPGAVGLCWGLYSAQEKKYLLGYPSPNSSVCDSVLVYDFLTKGFTLWDDIPGSCAVTFKFSGTNETVCFGDPNKGNIYELFQGDADIAGDNGTVTTATNTTLLDTSKSWTLNQFVDCRLGLIRGETVIPVGIITSNTAHTLTFTGSGTASNTGSGAVWGEFIWGDFIWGLPVTGPVVPGLTTPLPGDSYTIGYFTSYWKTKNLDFNMVGYTKKYRFLNLFTDTATYNMKFGYSIDFSPLSFMKDFRLTTAAPVWGKFTWGDFIWGGVTSEFGQATIGNTGRYIQFMFGNNRANQPWRVIRYGISYKLKKMRPNIVTD